jgi:hypothetical protein
MMPRGQASLPNSAIFASGRALTGALLIAVGLFTASEVFAGPAPRPPRPSDANNPDIKPTTTTVTAPNNKYGPGGTVESTSNVSDYRLLKEVFKDSAGTVRETIEYLQEATKVTVPDSTYGVGGTKVVYTSLDKQKKTEQLYNPNGVLREEHRWPVDPNDRSFDYYHAIYDTGGYIVGSVWIRPWDKGTWSLVVREYNSRAPGRPVNFTARVLFDKISATRDALTQDAANWEGQLKYWANGGVRDPSKPAQAGAVPDYGSANTGTPPPDTGYAFGRQPPQPGGLTIQCFGDAACERALAASRGETNLDFGRRDDKGGERDHRNDRPLYERPDLPRPELPGNSLPYEVPRGGLQYGR